MSGFSSPRNPAPLSGFIPSDLYEEDYAETLRNSLLTSSNFGSEGIVKCTIDLKPFVNTISAGSLVSGGRRGVDVFFAGMIRNSLSLGEVDELVAFIQAGGVVYISGDGESAASGVRYNTLFSTLSISDSFPNELIDFHPSGSSSDPIDTQVTDGPFGSVEPIHHSYFNPINTSSLQSVAYGFEELDFIGFSIDPDLQGVETDGEIGLLQSDYFRTILAEGSFGSGYLSVSGLPFYLWEGAENNQKYFLNLFALGCKVEEGKQLNVPLF